MRITPFGPALACALALPALVAPLAAQQARVLSTSLRAAVPVTAPALAPAGASADARAADSLFASAMRGARSGATALPEAARMLVESATLRAADDTLGAGSLAAAGKLLYAAGDLDGARAMLVLAGKVAVERSELPQAVFAYLDAANVAEEQENPALARELAARAARLAGSALLTPEQRKDIVARIRGE